MRSGVDNQHELAFLNSIKRQSSKDAVDIKCLLLRALSVTKKKQKKTLLISKTYCLWTNMRRA